MIMAMLDTSDAFDEDVHSEREALKDRCSKPTPPGLLFAAFTLTASLTPHSSLPIPLTPHSPFLGRSLRPSLPARCRFLFKTRLSHGLNSAFPCGPHSSCGFF